MKTVDSVACRGCCKIYHLLDCTFSKDSQHEKKGERIRVWCPKGHRAVQHLPTSLIGNENWGVVEVM